MNGYNGKKRFDRDQLVFVVEVILASAMDRIDSVMPYNFDLGLWCRWEDFKNSKQLQAHCSGAMETAGMALAVLYAQLTDDGLAICDALEISGMYKAVDKFRRERQRPSFHLKPGQLVTPNMHSLAEKFVSKMFGPHKQPCSCSTCASDSRTYF